MGKSYDRGEKLGKVYEMMNKLLLPFARGLGRSRGILESYYKRDVKPLTILKDPVKRVITLIIELPATKRLVQYHIYVSTQESCPIYPKQLEPKLRKLFSEAVKYNAQSDRGYYIICPVGYTRGAKEEIKKKHVYPATSAEEVLRNIAKYFKNRFVGLINALRGKRLFGELALLVWILQEILKQLKSYIEKEVKPIFKSEIEVTHAALGSGITL